jgi:hypothetical protein
LPRSRHVHPSAFCFPLLALTSPGHLPWRAPGCSGVVAVVVLVQRHMAYRAVGKRQLMGALMKIAAPHAARGDAQDEQRSPRQVASWRGRRPRDRRDRRRRAVSVRRARRCLACHAVLYPSAPICRGVEHEGVEARIAPPSAPPLPGEEPLREGGDEDDFEQQTNNSLASSDDGQRIVEQHILTGYESATVERRDTEDYGA